MAASITQPLVDLATNVIGDLGTTGIFLLSVLGSAFIPVPNEAVMLFAGFKVSDGRFTMLEVLVAGVTGNVVGSWVAYAVGYYGRVELLTRHGRWLHITPERIAWTERWFERYGGRAVFGFRLLPLVRTFISLPAGLVRMSFWRFTWLITLGSIPWCAGFAIAGKQLGEGWDHWQQELRYVDYLIVATIVVAIVYLIVRRRRASADSAAAPNAPS